MPALFFLVTADQRLAAAWARQLPADAEASRWNAANPPAVMTPDTGAVAVVDGRAAAELPAWLTALTTIWVGAGAPAGDTVVARLSEAESAAALGPTAAMVAQLAQQRAIAAVLAPSAARASAPEGQDAPIGRLEDELWDLSSALWENRNRPDEALSELQRAARRLLRSDDVALFVRERGIYRDAATGRSVPAGDALPRVLAQRPVVWTIGALADDPAAEVALRSWMSRWAAHLLAPLPDRGRLAGWLIFGRRRDGGAYSPAERMRAGLLGALAARIRGPDAAGDQLGGGGKVVRELGLTLAHELGNALVSLATLHQWQGDAPPPELLAAARRDIGRIENLHRDLALLQEFEGSTVQTVDLRSVVGRVGEALQLPVQTGPEPVEVAVVPALLEFALRTIAAAALETHTAEKPVQASLQLRWAPADNAPVPLVSLRGAHIEVSGIVPESEVSAVPNQGRVALFLAKQILRFHGGEIHRGPGPIGDEILISLRPKR